MPNVDTLRGLILHYFAELKAGSFGPYHCSKCHDERQVTTTMELVEPPEILVVALRRMKPFKDSFKKISRCIKIGGTVTLRSKNGAKSTYELVSAVKHIGKKHTQFNNSNKIIDQVNSIF